MDLTTLKAHIQTKKFNNYYIFTGPENKVMDIYIKQMAKVMGATVRGLDSIVDLVRKAHTASMLKNASVFVIRDDNTFMSDDALQAKITQLNTFGDDIIIFVYTTLDKRSKLYKNYQESIVEFDPLKEDVLIKYMQKEINLSEANCKKLIKVCESSYSRILLEIDKITHYSYCIKDIITGVGRYDRAFVKLLEDGTIYRPAYDAVFEFVDAVLRNEPKLAFNLLEQSYTAGEATMVLLSNLYNSTKQLLQVQSYKGNSLIEATGLTPFQVKLAKGRVGVYRVGDLVYLMRIVRYAEKGIKTGEIEDAMAIPYILVKFWCGEV